MKEGSCHHPFPTKRDLSLAPHAVSHPEQDAALVIAATRTAGREECNIFDAVLQAASIRAFNHVLKTLNTDTQDAFVWVADHHRSK